MSDPQQPMADGDPRDEQLASLLAVEPLDDVTRRRLVDTALRAASRRPWARYAVAAAVALALAGGGTALLVGQSGDHQTATRQPTRRPGAALVPTGPGPPTRSAAAPAALPVDLGDYGELGDTSNVARLRLAVANAAGQSSAQRAASDLAGPLATARACAHPTEPVTAVATGTVSGRAAVVLVSGRRLTVVVLSPCEVRPLGT